MARKVVISEAMIQDALYALDRRIELPPPFTERTYSRREAFTKLRAKAKEALAAGHPLETVVEDLRRVGFTITVATARQYLKPGKKRNSPRSTAQPEPQDTPHTMVTL